MPAIWDPARQGTIKSIKVFHIIKAAPDARSHENMAAVGRIDAEIGHHQGLQPLSNASKKAVDEMVAISLA